MEYKDRRTGLILFGILEIFLGLGCGLMALVMVFGAAAAPQAAGAPMRMMLPLAFLYLAVAAGFITIGIGSIMALRWAHALALAFSWWWLVIGVLTCFALLAMMPRMLATLPPDQAAAKPFMIGCMSATTGLFFLLLPLAFVLFYRSPNVKATVEARDPVHRWTDDVPLPLLVFALWMIAGGAAMVLCSPIYTSFPFGRWMIRGPAVPAITLGFAALMLFIGFGALKRKWAAW